ncbi:putative late blight resistance protein R1B-16 [Capsicum annuum]
MAQNDINNDEIVGFENEAEKIIQYLIRGTNELDVVPIVGMGGQGKTTIARKVYDNMSNASHFDVQAWCIISQTYNRIKILQEIFSQVTNSKDKGDQDDDVLADKLRKSLMGKRYVIILDDMWDGMAWDDLRLCFPDVGNRSRIIVTTRLEEVANQVKHHTDPYSLPFLPLDESCKLLQKKVFQQECCPPELRDVSLAVAEKCKGLPLIIVLVAGIIKRNKMEASWWDEVKNSLFSRLGESEDYTLLTMQLSYDNLPDYLKPCFLYMGMFPEDERIQVSKLISLWIAECFVQNIESAEDYLMHLISSNVLMVAKREYNGKVKYCQLHDVVLYFCLEKSREEKFMQAIKGDFQPSDWKENRVSWNPFNQCSELISEFASLGSETQKPLQQDLISLITTNRGGFSDSNFFRKVSEMRLLRVLDLSSHRVDSFSSATLKPLIHLKYLAIYTENFHFHPESHLPHLETLFVVCPKYSNSTLLPSIFWKMEKLRHVDFIGELFYLEECEQRMFEESSKLENLRILKGVGFQAETQEDISFMEDVLLRRCPNLQELDISYKGNYWSYSPEPYSLKLESLTQLQSLRLSFVLKFGLQLPSNLKKLVLTWTHIESVMPYIAGLPSLEYLHLDSFYRSKYWCVGDVTFHQLKFLKLENNFFVSRWDVSEESFPLLETLVIKGHCLFEEIPLSFADVPTLKQIKLINLFGSQKESMKASAVRIKKEVEESEGCDRIDLIVRG